MLKFWKWGTGKLSPKPDQIDRTPCPETVAPQMQIVNGIYLPTGDEHFAEQVRNSPLVGEKGTYQLGKLTAALECVPKDRRRTAIDVGAHVGLWTRLLAREFDRVIAVEPTQKHVECLIQNVKEANGKVEIWQFPLADKTRTLRLKSGTEVSTTSVCLENEKEDFTLRASPLDEYRLNDEVDFIKLDCEGFEFFVIQGAEETIRRCRPVIVVEQKKKRISRYGLDRNQPAVKLLQSWGMVEFWAKAGDHCLGWE